MHARLFALALSTLLGVSAGAPPAAADQTPPAPQPLPPANPQRSPAPAVSPQAGAPQPPAPQPSALRPSAAPQSAGTPSSAAPQPDSARGPGNLTTRGQPPPPVPPVLPLVPNVGAGYAAPAGATLPSGDFVGINMQPFVGIALDDAIAMALQKNTDLALAQSNQRIANYQIVAAQGAYDVRFQLQPQYQHSVTPAVSSFQAGPGGGPVTQDSAGATAGLTGITPGGTQFTIGASGTRITSNSTINSFNPFYETALSFNVTQPLLRGRTVTDASRALQLAAANAQINRDVALTTAAQTIANVSNTYWDLVAAWRNVGIQEEGLRQAQAQAESNARLSRRGAVAPVDIVESNTQVNVFTDNVFAAVANVQRLQTQMKALIVANPGDPVWLANLVPTSPVLVLPAEPKLDDLVISALRNRPEIAQLRAARLTAQTNLAFAKDQLKPQLNLNLGYTTNGFAGIPTDPNANPIFGILGGEIAAINALIARANAGQAPANQIPLLAGTFAATPANQTGGFAQSTASLLQNRYPTYAVGLTLSFPLQNRTAKAEYGIAEEQAKQVAVQEIALLQRIRGESVNAVQQLREAQYRLVAASNARTASERVLLAEQRRFAVGSSTTFLILQRQLDVANNRGRELQAQTDLNKAVVELNRVGGTVFATYNIDASALGAGALGAASPIRSNLPPMK
ncbi:MAG: TolC family protein [Candidatus Velthaea sp.]